MTNFDWIGLGRFVGDHLWQSTLFAGLSALLTLAFQKHRAQVRFGLWLAASLKLLIPFAALVAIGSHFGLRSAAPAPFAEPSATFLFDAASQPFTELAGAPPAPVSHSFVPLVSVLFLAIWFCGFSSILLVSWIRLRRAAKAIREGSRAQEGRELELLRRAEAGAGIKKPVALIFSNQSVEPYVFGILAPVLLWPQSISRHLSDAQVEAILVHELAHVRRRDNLAASVHLLVEAIFWFHPLVWWLGKRMVEERERACDEEALQRGIEPITYADGILKICELYLSSPASCAAGVTGSDLKKRMERIMRNHLGTKLNGWRRLLLATAGVAALALPVVAGVLFAPRRQDATTGNLPKFDVASIKQNKSGDTGGRLFIPPGGGVAATNASLRQFIRAAYQLTNAQIGLLSGVPGWIDSEHFDIDAKAEGKPSVEQTQLMLQSLLADRFKLVLHHETRQLPEYAIVLSKPGKTGPQFNLHTDHSKCFDTSTGLPPAGPGGQIACGGIRRGPSPGHMTGQKTTMEMVASVLDTVVDRVVVDRTGLMGTFDFDLTFTPEPLLPSSQAGGDSIASDPSAPPSIFTALQEQLGLKLEPTTGPVDVLVIDHVEEPTPN